MSKSKGLIARSLHDVGIASWLGSMVICALAVNRATGTKISDAGDVPMRDGATPTDTTPDDVASALRQQSVLQVVLPVLTGALVVMGTLLGEQQRPTHVASGVLHRLNPAA